jgi:hypothetical protein
MNASGTGSARTARCARLFVRLLSTVAACAASAASAGPAGGDDLQFGRSVAIDGDTAVVGVPGLDVDVGGVVRPGQGAVVVYTRVGNTWGEQARLVASDGDADHGFGFAVAIAGDTVLVGAPFAPIGAGQVDGAAYVFTRSAGAWVQQAKLVGGPNPGSSAFENFGSSVGVAGDTAVAGATLDPVGGIGAAGSVYVFTRSAGQWTAQSRLVATDVAQNAGVGVKVAISGDTVVAGSFRAPAGAAYVFVRNGGNWSQQAKLTGSDSVAGDRFAESVAISGNTVLVGAPGVDRSAIETDLGAAYVFVRTATVWSQQARLVGAAVARLDGFGTVAVEGDTALIGAQGTIVDGNPSRGAAYVFVRSSGSWGETARLAGFGGVAGARYGDAVALSSGTALIGGFSDLVDQQTSGAVQVCAGAGTQWSPQQRITIGTLTPGTDAVARDGFEPC